MQFKVGDRVEVLTPAEGVGKELSNEVGVGTIKAIGNDLSVKVELPGNFHSWWYKPEQLRHAVEEIEIHPTPSITVGTQVRLTGVVVGPTRKEDDAQGVLIKGSAVEGLRGPLVFIKPDYLEVIRQPFKRGEVVWSCGAVATGEQYVVFNDETNGRVDVVHCLTGTATTDNDISRFERRP